MNPRKTSETNVSIFFEVTSKRNGKVHSVRYIKDKFIWIAITHETPGYDDLVKKYKNKVLPTAHFCLFNGKAITRLAGAVSLKTFGNAMKKLLRKNKSAWKKEKKKRDKAKKEEDKKAEEEKKTEEEKKEPEKEKEAEEEKPEDK